MCFESMTRAEIRVAIIAAMKKYNMGISELVNKEGDSEDISFTVRHCTNCTYFAKSGGDPIEGDPKGYPTRYQDLCFIEPKPLDMSNTYQQKFVCKYFRLRGE